MNRSTLEIVWRPPILSSPVLFQDLAPGEFFVWAGNPQGLRRRCHHGTPRYSLVESGFIQAVGGSCQALYARINSPVHRVDVKIIATVQE